MKRHTLQERIFDETGLTVREFTSQLGIKPSVLLRYHNSWLEQKLNDGWVHGDVKDPVARCHPCVTAYENLPESQGAKDYIFRAIIQTLS